MSRAAAALRPPPPDQPVMPTAAQPRSSPRHRGVPTAAGLAGGMQVTTRRDGALTSVNISGELTEAGTRRLAAMLNAMAWAEGERATIHLSDVSCVGSDLLRVLRTARTRAQDRLTVTAQRPEVRFALALVGLGEMAWPEQHERTGGHSEVDHDAPFRA